MTLDASTYNENLFLLKIAEPKTWTCIHIRHPYRNSRNIGHMGTDPWVLDHPDNTITKKSVLKSSGVREVAHLTMATIIAEI